MAGSAALLIDLENFFLGRESNYFRTHQGGTYEFPIDLESLCSFATDIAGRHRLVVRRAYANFNDRRPGSGERQWDYYLQPMPRFLMERGVEPVQVFRFPGGGNKNAADMRLAMDATVLRQTPTTIDLFILVTGDADFIPVVLELQRTGAHVVVIGVEGCTNSIFQRYCDRFEFFEDLLAARELQRLDDHDLSPVRVAMRTILERRSPIKFAAVKPLLSDQLGTPFNPSRWGCDSTGDFLRKHATTLGVILKRGEHDWEVSLRGHDDSNVDGAPAERDPVLELDPAAQVAAEGHTVEIYVETLRTGMPRCYVVGNSDLRAITDAIFQTVTDASGKRIPVMHPDLLNRVTETCDASGMEEAGRKVRDVTFQLFKAGCFQCAVEGPLFGQTDFHWSKPAMLAPDIETPTALRRRCFDYLLKLLGRRLELRGASQRVQLAPAVELLCGAEPHEDDVALVRELLAEKA